MNVSLLKNPQVGLRQMVVNGRFQPIDSDPLSGTDVELRADAETGLAIFVKAGCTVPGTLHVVCVNQEQVQRRALPFLRVELAPASKLDLVITHLGEGTPDGQNKITELVVGKDASLDLTLVEAEDPSAVYSHSLSAILEENAHLRTQHLVFGGKSSRTLLNFKLNQPHANLALHGLVMGNKHQHHEVSVQVEHLAEHTQSEQNYRGVFDGFASGIFNGKIIVQKDAQKTNARQVNKNLILGRGAKASSQPQLEIYADDVKCSHGATIAQLDPKQLFYLRSRGVAEPEARTLLIQAFAQSVLDTLMHQPLKTFAEQRVQGFFRNIEGEKFS